MNYDMMFWKLVILHESIRNDEISLRHKEIVIGSISSEGSSGNKGGLKVFPDYLSWNYLIRNSNSRLICKELNLQAS